MCICVYIVENSWARLIHLELERIDRGMVPSHKAPREFNERNNMIEKKIILFRFKASGTLWIGGGAFVLV